MILTTTEAAARVGVSEATIRTWVMRGKLEPLRRASRPLRFHDDDVTACAYLLSDREAHARAYHRWLGLTRGQLDETIGD